MHIPPEACPEGHTEHSPAPGLGLPEPEGQGTQSCSPGTLNWNVPALQTQFVSCPPVLTELAGQLEHELLFGS